jgi:predicted kinase
MSGPGGPRSVRISDDERGGWSSDRPRREGGPVRPADIGVRCRVLQPTDRMRYSPGSLLLILSASLEERDRFAGRVIEDRGALLSLERVRGLLAGRVPEDQIEAKAAELLEAAAAKRLNANESVVIAAGVLDAEGRERFARLAAANRRPRHLILVETSRDQVAEEDRIALNELRTVLDAGELGAEGFHSALRLGGGTIGELKRIVFRPEPREE